MSYRRKSPYFSLNEHNSVWCSRSALRSVSAISRGASGITDEIWVERPWNALKKSRLPRDAAPALCRTASTVGLTQYESDEITSPPARLTRARKVTGFTESLRKRTLPSPIKTLMPPGWNDASSSLLPA